jgi:uncharacterized protein
MRAALLLALALAASAAAQDLQPVPALEARVTDLTGTLTAEQQATLEDKLRAFEARKGSQLAVLIVPTTAPEDIAQYGIRVVDQWKLGREKVDDGALLIVAKNDRRMRIEVGYGLEGTLPDATASRIIAETIAPLFRQGDYFGGINAGLDQMIRVVDGEPLPPPDTRWKGGGDTLGPGLLFFLVVTALIVSTILRSALGRPLGSVLTGAGVGVAAYIVTSVLALAAIAGIVAFLFSLFASLGSRGWSSSARHGGWGGGWSGGTFGGGGWGGGGGFGGGGGGFGGGGASGGW